MTALYLPVIFGIKGPDENITSFPCSSKEAPALNVYDKALNEFSVNHDMNIKDELEKIKEQLMNVL